MKRRDFIKKSGAAVAAAYSFDSVFSKALAKSDRIFLPSSRADKVPTLQGATSDTETQFTLLSDIRSPFNVRILDPNNRELKFTSETFSAPTGRSNFEIIKVFVKELSPNINYLLQMVDNDSGEIRDERVFSTLEVRKKRKLRFAIISCMSDQFFDSGELTWPALLREQPECVFIIGDACYVNHAEDTLENMWMMHTTSRLRIPYYYAQKLIPTMFTWDDHDTGKNNCDSNYSKLPQSTEIWQLFYGSKNIPGTFENGDGTNCCFTGFGQNFYLMDNRSYLDKNLKNPSFWGSKGDEFLFSRLEKSHLPSYIMTGVQFFGGYLLGSESYEKTCNKDFKNCLSRLSKVESPVVFASGDVHFSEIMKLESKLLGYETLEITSSSIHSSTFPGMQFRSYNKRRLMSTSAHNYVILESQPFSPPGLIIDLKSAGAKNEVFFKHSTIVQR